MTTIPTLLPPDQPPSLAAFRRQGCRRSQPHRISRYPWRHFAGKDADDPADGYFQIGNNYNFIKRLYGLIGSYHGLINMLLSLIGRLPSLIRGHADLIMTLHNLIIMLYSLIGRFPD
jgi:hypothetical protein